MVQPLAELTVLQRGRRCEAAEGTGTPGEQATFRTGLQRGRRGEAAEGIQPGRCGSPASCFNEAAGVRLRKAVPEEGGG